MGSNLEVPSRSWFAATVTGGAAIAVAWIQAGEFSTTVKIALVGFVAARAVAYLTPNATPDAEPAKGAVKLAGPLVSPKTSGTSTAFVSNVASRDFDRLAHHPINKTPPPDKGDAGKPHVPKRVKR